MRLVFAGTPEVAVPALDAIAGSRHELLAVITRPDAPAGRGRRMTPSPVARRAEDLGLEVLKPRHPRDEDFQDRLRRIAPDACPVVAYGALLPSSALNIPPHGWINLHFSLLPRWRGAAPVQRAVMAGDQRIGTTCFRIVEALDAGPVFATEARPMPDLTAGELLIELAHTGALQLVRTLDAVEEGATPRPQSEDGVTLAHKITPEVSRLDLRQPADRVRNHVLGCSPDPGAWCEYEGQRLKIFRAATVTAPKPLAPGELHVTRRQVFLGCGSGAVELLEVQAPGRRRMAAIDWARQGVSGSLT
ncbi:MAG: methionyl-tRNA formyltransferase [Arachnia propionica]|uniref:methionyl-tRNA formyltransferase n=1 Tax=Arachnia propionica TaxID=1750 RepID=UPI00270B7646|nr:methionyl-tRNA formyltransferase [Arachnia propionica]